jgi:putative ABC transport system permease protein
VRTILLLLLLSLGVAVFLSIRLANRAAVASFANFAGVLSQQMDATILAPAGTLPESLLRTLRDASSGKGTDATAGVELIPIVETVCAPPRSVEDGGIGARSTFTLLGVDLVALQNFAAEQRLDRHWLDQTPQKQGRGGEDGLGLLLRRRDAVFCSSKLAEREGLVVGSSLRVVLNDATLALEVAGIIPGRADQPESPSGLLVMDLPALQALSGKAGRLDRIECVFPKAAHEGANRERVLERLRAACGTTATVRTPESRRLAAEVMTRGFRLNLTILSLIALLVGLYLIFQALDASVVKRRGEIAVLRALGVRDSEVRRAWIWESVLLGLGGGVCGVAGGWALAQGTVRAVSQTVNALYYANNAEAAGLHAGEAVAAFFLAVACSVVAGWLPSKRAAATPPAQLWAQGGGVLTSQSQERSRTWVGWGMLAAAVGLAFCPPVGFSDGTRFALGGYWSALMGVVGAGIVAGDGLRFAAWLGAQVSRRSAPRQIANSHLRLPTSRHRWAAAGLLCAVSMTGGMSVLVGSFERSVGTWITHLLQADIYLTSDANQSATAYNRISAATWKEITRDSDVADWDALLLVPVEFGGSSIRVAGTNLDFYQRHNQFSWLKAPKKEEIFDAKRNAGLCAVSESFSERFHAGCGDVIRVPTPSGVRVLEVAGVYTDYGDDQGVVMVDRVHAQEWFGTGEVSTLSLVLRQGKEAESVRARLRAEHPGLAVFTNTHLRGEVMRIFKQTFAITYALEAIGVVVALAGLGITLASILAERRAELTTLRALGMSRSDITQMAAWEGALLALGGTLGGLVTSLGLGALLIFVINKQTFGWTLLPAIPARALLVLGLVVPLAGALVAGIVGRFSADLPVDRTE